MEDNKVKSFVKEEFVKHLVFVDTMSNKVNEKMANLDVDMAAVIQKYDDNKDSVTDDMIAKCLLANNYAETMSTDYLKICARVLFMYQMFGDSLFEGVDDKYVNIAKNILGDKHGDFWLTTDAEGNLMFVDETMRDAIVANTKGAINSIGKDKFMEEMRKQAALIKDKKEAYLRREAETKAEIEKARAKAGELKDLTGKDDGNKDATIKDSKGSSDRRPGAAGTKSENNSRAVGKS